jgi:Rrf2 family protein
MRLSAHADYALRAAIELAAAEGDRVTAEQLSQAQGIPGQLLATILTHLRRGNIVRSQRGPDGGFWLARPAAAISLAEIIRAIDRQSWDSLRAHQRAVLEAVTLADIISGTLP